MGMRVVTEQEKDQFFKELEAAEKDMSDMKKREDNINAVFDKFERNIVLIGATAVEDRLQDNVP